MSLLSNPQATPERVFAVLQLLRELGGTASHSDVIAWMQPRGAQAESAIEAAISVAGDLSFIESNAKTLNLARDTPSDWVKFADVTHERLTTVDESDADTLLFEVIGWLIAMAPDDLARTVVGCTASECAGRISDGLSSGAAREEPRRFNSTKLTPWVRWMAFLGLGHDGGDGCHFLPFIATRMERELRAHVPEGREVKIDSLWTTMQKRMPYIDGGVVFLQVAARGAWRSSDQFTHVTSLAWLDLQRRDVIEVVTLGDSVGQMRLADGVREISAFPAINAVTLLPKKE